MSYLTLQSLTTVLHDSTVFDLGMKFARMHVFWLRDLSGERKKIYFDIPVLVMVLVDIAIYNNPTKENVSFLITMHLWKAHIITTTILHHLEIFHSIEYMIVYTKRLFTMVTTFGLVCGGCVSLFTRLFMMMSQLDGVGGCISQFSDFASGLYSKFLMLPNMLDVRGLSIGVPRGMACGPHGFVSIVGVLLYNLLIAMFSDEVDKVSENREVVLY